MEYSSFIQPEVKEIGGREFTISKIPAFTAKKVYQAEVDAIQKNGEIGKTLLPDDVLKVILAHTAVINDRGEPEVLSLPSVVEKTLTNYADLIKLTVAMLDYNFGFFVDGSLPSLLGLREEAEQASGS